MTVNQPPGNVGRDSLLEQFRWEPQPEAERVILELVREFLSHNAWAAGLARRMREETGTRFIDWVDHLAVAQGRGLEDRLREAGFMLKPGSGTERCYFHPEGMFPRVIVWTNVRLGDDRRQASIRVESVEDFAVANGLPTNALVSAGDPLSVVRVMEVSEARQTALLAVERHGYLGFGCPDWDDHQRVSMLHHREVFRTRRRLFDDEPEGFAYTSFLVDEAISRVGVGVACDLFFAAEREYWQRRNRAARVQKARQDRLGLGWANHDHHTYRSSRRHFARLIAVFEKLGFHCRERFYAGAQAGWGAQVLEQPDARVVIFADVDLSPDELLVDFAHEELPPRDALGTVGLWCALHGESFLEAGMHHLECQFDFDALKHQLETEQGVNVMKPFTNFPYLRQAFTEGEVWPVRPERIDRLAAAGLITPEQAKHFRDRGAIGSHLENLERNQGFKGFNQTGVSEIITRTDPRAQAQRGGGAS